MSIITSFVASTPASIFVGDGWVSITPSTTPVDLGYRHNLIAPGEGSKWGVNTSGLYLPYDCSPLTSNPGVGFGEVKVKPRKSNGRKAQVAKSRRINQALARAARKHRQKRAGRIVRIASKGVCHKAKVATKVARRWARRSQVALGNAKHTINSLPKSLWIKMAEKPVIPMALQRPAKPEHYPQVSAPVLKVEKEQEKGEEKEASTLAAKQSKGKARIKGAEYRRLKAAGKLESRRQSKRRLGKGSNKKQKQACSRALMGTTPNWSQEFVISKTTALLTALKGKGVTVTVATSLPEGQVGEWDASNNTISYSIALQGADLLAVLCHEALHSLGAGETIAYSLMCYPQKVLHMIDRDINLSGFEEPTGYTIPEIVDAGVMLATCLSNANLPSSSTLDIQVECEDYFLEWKQNNLLWDILFRYDAHSVRTEEDICEGLIGNFFHAKRPKEIEQLWDVIHNYIHPELLLFLGTQLSTQILFAHEMGRPDFTNLAKVFSGFDWMLDLAVLGNYEEFSKYKNLFTKPIITPSIPSNKGIQCPGFLDSEEVTRLSLLPKNNNQNHLPSQSSLHTENNQRPTTAGEVNSSVVGLNPVNSNKSIGDKTMSKTTQYISSLQSSLYNKEELDRPFFDAIMADLQEGGDCSVTNEDLGWLGINGLELYNPYYDIDTYELAIENHKLNPLAYPTPPSAPSAYINPDDCMFTKKWKSTMLALMGHIKMGVSAFPKAIFERYDIVIEGHTKNIFEGNLHQRHALRDYMTEKGGCYFTASVINTFKDGCIVKPKEVDGFTPYSDKAFGDYVIEVLSKRTNRQDNNVRVLVICDDNFDLNTRKIITEELPANMGNVVFAQMENYPKIVTAGLINTFNSLGYSSDIGELVSYMYNLERVYDNDGSPTNRYTKATSSIGATYTQVEFDFTPNNLKVVGRNREFHIRGLGYIHGCGHFQSEVLLALLAAQMIGMNSVYLTQTKVEAILAELTQIFEEEHNYGQELKNSDQLNAIRSNSVAIMNVEYNRQYWPFFNLYNDNKGTGCVRCLEYFLSLGIPAFPDKNATKRVVINEGVTALYGHFDFELDIFYTILDTLKAGKLFTRGSQCISLAAGESYQGLSKFWTAYVEAGLAIHHRYSDGRDPLDMFVTGDRRNTLTCDLRFLNNGSGVGYSWTTFAAGIHKVLTTTINYTQLRKQGKNMSKEDDKKSLETYANQLKTDAEAYFLSQPRHYKSSEVYGQSLWEWNKIQMFQYSGHNQDFAIGREYGSTVEVSYATTTMSINVKLKVFYHFEDATIKGRGLGIKAVLAPAYNRTVGLDGKAIKNDKVNYKARVYNADNTVNNDVEVLLGAECLKGNAARLAQYGEWIKDKCGERVYLLGGEDKNSSAKSMQSLYSPAFDAEWNRIPDKYIYEDLSSDNCQFMRWWKEHTKEYKLRDAMSKQEFFKVLFMVANLYGWTVNKHNFNKAITSVVGKKANIALISDKGQVIDWDFDYINSRDIITIEETFSGVLAPYVYQIELASIREVTNDGQSMTIQQYMSQYIASAQAAGHYLAGSEEIEDKVMDLIGMATNNPLYKVGIQCAIQDKFENSSVVIKYPRGNKKQDMTLTTLVESNNSKTNGGINALIYQNGYDPYREFFDVNPNKFKAQILINTCPIFKNAEESDKRFSLKESFVSVANGSCKVYTINVGVGYGLASVATTLALNAYHEWMLSEYQDADLAMYCVKALKVMGICWFTFYENAALASYNKKGVELYEQMWKILRAKEPEPIESINKYLEAIEGEGNFQPLDKQELDILLKVMRIRNFTSAIEKRSYIAAVKAWPELQCLNVSTGDTQLDTKSLFLGYIAACTRRLDQGKFALNDSVLSYLDSDSEDKEGSSPWETMFEQVQSQDGFDFLRELVPDFLVRKLFKAAYAQITIRAMTIVRDSIQNEADHPNLAECKQILGNFSQVVVGENVDYHGLIDTNNEAMLNNLYNAGIPLISAIGAHYRNSNEPIDLFYKGQAVTSTPKELNGVFIEHLQYYRKKTGEYYRLVDSIGNGGLLSYTWEKMKEKPKDWDDSLTTVNTDGGVMMSRRLSPKEMLQAAAKRYPEGVILLGNEPRFNLYVNFKSILGSGAFSSSGATIGYGLKVTQLMRLINLGVDHWNGDANRMVGELKGMLCGLPRLLAETLKAGVLKRIGKTGKVLVGAKVLTSHSLPYVTVKAEGKVIGEVPMALLNPNDALVEVLELDITKHYAVSCSRSPMVANGSMVLGFSSAVPIGMIAQSAVYNALIHRGDGDGDPTALYAFNEVEIDNQYDIAIRNSYKQ